MPVYRMSRTPAQIAFYLAEAVKYALANPNELEDTWFEPEPGTSVNIWMEEPEDGLPETVRIDCYDDGKEGIEGSQWIGVAIFAADDFPARRLDTYETERQGKHLIESEGDV